MMKNKILILVSSIYLILACSEEKKHKEAPKENVDKKDYISIINEELIKEAKITKKKKRKPKQENWVLIVGDKEISKETFEDAYNKFLEEADSNIDKTNFVFVFLQNYFLLPKAQKHFEKNAATRNFVKRQLVIQSFIKDRLLAYRKNIKVHEDELVKFYNYLRNTKEYKKLKLNKDRNKIIELYKISKANQKYMEFEQSVKGQYSIISNDEWVDSIIEKYKAGSFDKTKALSAREYKKYWLYKINYNNKTKEKLLTIKDIENKINLSKRLKGPSIKSSIPKDKGKLLDRFLTEELIYLYIKTNGLIRKYRRITEVLMSQFVIEYYFRKVLGLSTKEKQKKYIEEFINLQKIKLNDLYFN